MDTSKRRRRRRRRQQQVDGSGSFGAKRDPVGDDNAGGLNDVAPLRAV